ncbi:uncharacterized protein LOC129596986 [Paramacrobiotus metropolitanus]|uniref:uncharacterized protein LOC129596986 n=1 Tax=Paramacrobiotus metropolitanus TaxID=2943436 RepID=UPI002445C4C8|nr:uncharacterized protein LOC129596986 [Paramacrobiotus metropolitanus]
MATSSFNLARFLQDRELPTNIHPTPLQRSLNSPYAYARMRLARRLVAAANWGADFSASGDLFVCRGPAGSSDEFHLQFWNWEHGRLVSHCPYPLNNHFHTRCLDDYAVVWDRETCFLGIVAVETASTYLMQLMECQDAVDAVAVLPGCFNEILIADDKGRLYMRDRRKPHLIPMGQVQVITADCQSVTSLSRNPAQPHEFCVCSSWGRQLVIGDLRTAGRHSTAPVASRRFHFFQQRGPDTFSAEYNHSGTRLLVHWENGLLLSDPHYTTTEDFHLLFSTHLDLFDVRWFGGKEEHVLLGHQMRAASDGMDTVEIRDAQQSGGVVQRMGHPVAGGEDGGGVHFGMKLYVHPWRPVFAVGSSDDTVLFYQSSL